MAHYRLADENIAAHPLMVKAWLLSNNGEQTGFSFSDEELQALTLIENSQPITPEQFFRQVRMSRLRAEQLLIRMLSLGNIAMRHTSAGFLIVTAD